MSQSIQELRIERKLASKSASTTHIDEVVWVCQTDEFLPQLSKAFSRAKDFRKPGVLHYALACIRVGKAEYDLSHRRYDRDHWFWPEEKLREWCYEEDRKAKELETQRKQLARKGGAQ